MHFCQNLWLIILLFIPPRPPHPAPQDFICLENDNLVCGNTFSDPDIWIDWLAILAELCRWGLFWIFCSILHILNMLNILNILLHIFWPRYMDCLIGHLGGCWWWIISSYELDITMFWFDPTKTLSNILLLDWVGTKLIAFIQKWWRGHVM